MRLRIMLGVLALCALLFFGALYYFISPTGGAPYTLEIKPGMSLTEIAADLKKHQIIRSDAALRLMMRWRKTASSIHDGFYDFSGSLSIDQVAEVLAHPGRPRIVTVVVPEGKRLAELPIIFTEAGLSNLKSLEAAFENVQASSFARTSLEGFLFPATYTFYPEVSAPEIVQALVDRMLLEFTPERITAAEKLSLDVYGWVTLASMVQVEAASDAEMPIIAGVFLNRLESKMPLGSDPTVAYGLGKALPELDRYEGDFLKDTPYNTYRRVGLPPGPISNPGQAALLAVLKSKRTIHGKPAFYFLHGADNQIHVNATYDAHLKDNRRYR